MIALAIFQTDSLGLAYEIYDRGAKVGLTGFEISPLGRQGHLILEGKKEDLYSFALDLKMNLHDNSEEENSEDGTPKNPFQIKICEVDQEVLQTYLSIQQGQLKDHLLILESSFLGHIFDVVQELKGKGVAVLDLRAPKTEPATSFAFMTVEDSVWNFDLQIQMKEVCGENVRWRVIENPHEELRSYFEQ